MAPVKIALSEYRRAARNIVARDQVVTVPRLARILKIHRRTLHHRIHTCAPWLVSELHIVRGTKIDKDLNDQAVQCAAEMLLRSDGVVTPKRIAELLHKKENTIVVYLRKHPLIVQKYRIVPYKVARVLIAAHSIPAKERTIQRVLSVFREKFGFGSVASIRLYMRTHSELMNALKISILPK